jgi:ABC-type nickel/cobalt efflux system permease component RcnA
MTAAGAPAGAVVRGDYLSLLLHQKQLSLSMILLALAAAFGLGAVHALTPGHGKAIVAAYLVGARGTVKHAAFLGAMVTFTHTITVFALGLATLFLFRFIVPEKITVFLGALSGLSIVAIGAFMLGKRVRQGGRGHSHSHAHTHAPVHSHANAQIHIHTHADGTTHSHSHAPTHKHVHEHVHSHEHSHTHKHDHALAAHTQAGTHAHTHSHGIFGSHTHAHVPEDLSWGGLVALGASGGLVPCESALVLLLGAIALGRIGLGLLLLVSFSLGLALVLMVIGILVLYAKNLLPERTRSGGHPLLRWASIASPAIVMLVGLVMTAASLGLIQSKWMIG